MGGARSFNGTSDYINVGSGTSLNLTTAFTIGSWIKPDILNKSQDHGLVNIHLY